MTDKFGSYPYDQIGGVATTARLGFALETQTRPVYDAAFFFDRDTSVIVHEMAHQWFGDAVALQRWKSIWINEGYATYAEWIFAADRGGQSAERRFRDLYERYSAGDTFWKLRIGDPGPNNIFDGAVYVRGAMTLHALRNRIGGDAFFKLSRRWVKRPGGVASMGDYRRLAERISGEDLGSFFDAWLYSGDKPDLP
ncbi:MAG: M1 family aminopeptidase [Nocardioidaceae bacterium]